MPNNVKKAKFSIQQLANTSTIGNSRSGIHGNPLS